MIAEDAAWNVALAGWFFREDFAGRPVFLCVDEETLAAVGRESGTAPDNALDSLTHAVRAGVRANAPLESWIAASSAWRRSGFVGPPPFLSVLAVTVLAATMLGDPNDRSYYLRLNGLLGVAGRAMPRYFDSDIQQLWTGLNEWLTDVEHGARGVATATNLKSSFPNVGWALSQTVLRPSDRAKLPFLFSALGVYPGQQVDGQLLVAGLRRSGLASQGMSRRLSQVLDDATLTESLAATLASELATWDGTLRDETGRRATQLLLTFHQRSRAFGVAVRTPADLANLHLSVAGADPVALGEAGDVQLLPVPVTASLLDGANLPAQLLDPVGDREPRPIGLLMPRVDLHLLTPNDGLARWVDIRPAELHRPHLVLVRAEMASAAAAVMASLGGTAPRVASVPCPAGWRCYQFEPVRTVALDGPLSVLSPRGAEVSTLDGGLPISARSRLFLTSGPPDVLLDLTHSEITAAVDGQPIQDIGPAGRLRLADRGLTAGTHRIDVGGTHLRLRLVDDHAVGPAACSLAVALRAETSPAGRPWTIPAWTGARDSDRHGDDPPDILVRGASLELSERGRARTAVDTAPPAQARSGGRHFALGVGRVAAPVYPRLPEWLMALEPQPLPHMVDLSSCTGALPFPAAWFLRITNDHATVVPAGEAQPSGQRPDVAATAQVNAWDEVRPWLATATPHPDHAAAWTAWRHSVESAGSHTGGPG